MMYLPRIIRFQMRLSCSIGRNTWFFRGYTHAVFQLNMIVLRYGCRMGALILIFRICTRSGFTFGGLFFRRSGT
jgi:hypothetical protein